MLRYIIASIGVAGVCGSSVLQYMNRNSIYSAAYEWSELISYILMMILSIVLLLVHIIKGRYLKDDFRREDLNIMERAVLSLYNCSWLLMTYLSYGNGHKITSLGLLIAGVTLSTLIFAPRKKIIKNNKVGCAAKIIFSLIAAVLIISGLIISETLLIGNAVAGLSIIVLLLTF